MPLDLLSSLVLYVAICVAVTAVGLGVMRLLGVGVEDGRSLLAPIFAIAGWTVILGVIVQVGIPIQELRTALWMSSAAAAVFGILGGGLRDVRAHIWRFLLAATATAVLLNAYLIHGWANFAGSPILDGWSYSSYGQYLYMYAKGTEGALAPLYQYAAHLSGTRFVSSAILAALQPPFCLSCDTQRSVGPFLAIAVFAFSGSCAYLAKNVLRSPPFEFFFVVVCVLGGWLIGAIHVNNFDNILILPIAPAIAALALFDPTSARPRVWTHALLLAAAAYIYPEMLPLTVVLYGLLLVNAAHLARSYEIYIRFAGKVALASLLLTLPYLASLVPFFWGQLTHAVEATGPRAGEGWFPALLRFDALINELWGMKFSQMSEVFGVGFFLLLLTGTIRLLCQSLFAPAVFIAAVGSLFTIMVLGYHYDYGAFKALLFGWWAIVLTVSVGLKHLWQLGFAGRVNSRPTAWALALVMASPSVYVWSKTSIDWYDSLNEKSIQPFRELYNVASMTKGAAVRVNINNALQNAWAVYFLRDAPASFTNLRGYMAQPHVVPFMARTSQTANGEFLLADRGSVLGDLVWSNSHFALWRQSGEALSFIEDVQSPNGLEQLDGEPFFWIGSQPAKVSIYSNAPRTVRIAFEARRGPSVSDGDDLKIVVSISGLNLKRTLELKPAGNVEFEIDLDTGMTLVEVGAVHGGDLRPVATDPRTLIVGIRGMRLSPAP